MTTPTALKCLRSTYPDYTVSEDGDCMVMFYKDRETSTPIEEILTRTSVEINNHPPLRANVVDNCIRVFILKENT